MLTPSAYRMLYTQYDYQKGKLDELLDVIIEEKASLFVCAVGVPPPHAVEKLHKAGIPIMNVSSLATSVAIARVTRSP
jgi:NAD(P)H-dependent flavin oxidoreductase YrpB (nitropropane dioxygenase family)